MRNNSSAKSPVKKDFRDVYLGIRYDKMTEQNWVSVYPVLPPISMEDFESDYDKALAELGISQDELVENGAVTLDFFQSHLDIISNFRYLYGDDVNGLYGDEEDGDDGDANMYDALYASRCMGNHTRYRRRMDDFRTRARKISAGIGNVVSEGGSINPGFMYVRTKKLEHTMKKAKFILDLVKDVIYWRRLLGSPDDVRHSEKKLSQAKRNMFKLKRAFIKNNRACKKVIKLARHYSIYCAGYNRYLRDKWVKDDVASQDTSCEKQSNASAESSKAHKLLNTSEKFVVNYDMPSKKSAFARNRDTRHGVCASPKKNTHITDVQPTVEVATVPVIMPVYSHVSGHGCFCF